MKTDTIFYSLFQAFPSIFFELINQSPTEAGTYEFTSREVKQLAFRLDGLFLPTTKDAKKPFYIVEVQFQPDDNLYYRLFAELFLYLRQYKTPHPWQAVIIYPSRNIEREQNLQFGEILLLQRVTRIYLDELGESSLGVGVVKLVIETEKDAPALARRLIAQANQQLTDTKIKRDLINLIETIIVYKLPKKSREEIEAMLGLSELKQTRVYQEALEEGKAEGEAKGKAEATRKFALKLLRTGMNLQQIAEVTELSLQQIQALQKEIQES
ncbi:Rpn family recombination-promoting nuclease/putative transposase [Dolichospermum planctonicum UHCC 0167]|uniref:Rpn family recombination-promoting nuclease/putative transposase n=1 Tax=Dolichospermum planctonicum TaxID=136072 RepID=UPI00144380F0|nr:Rpn family recombination-promoting nuclease/putative transposase [Dolichospermum planctonicum]MCW9682740.1 Rpn family recombination-promoting nuclease/putative transposase [Dolichospermum planctonicum UHCC 0167]